MALILWFIFDKITGDNSEKANAENAKVVNNTSELVDSLEKVDSVLSELKTDSAVYSHPDYYKYQPDSILAYHLARSFSGPIIAGRSPWGGFVLLANAKTGEILAWAERKDSLLQMEPSYLNRSDFPAASLSKIVTAAAALENKRFGNNSLIPMKGKPSKLYQNQLENTRGARKVSLESAFAASMNPPFGIVGQRLGGKKLTQAAKMLGFNRVFPMMKLQPSVFNPPDTGFAVAEAASGFTNENTISPLIAGSIAAGIWAQKPTRLLWSEKMGIWAPSTPLRVGDKFSKNTYYGLKKMFQATVDKGSARSYRRKLYNRRSELVLGGKTGTKDLPQKNGPEWRMQWFAGYAEDPDLPDYPLAIVIMKIDRRIDTRGKESKRASSTPTLAAVMTNQWVNHYLSRFRKDEKKK